MALLDCVRTAGVSAIHMTMHHGQDQAVRALVQAVLASDLPLETRLAVIRRPRVGGETPLVTAIDRGQIACVAAYAQAVLTAPLEDSLKRSLLLPDRSADPALHQALRAGPHARAAAAAMRAELTRLPAGAVTQSLRLGMLEELAPLCA